MGEYGHFLQLHNAVHRILCLNLLLLIMNHTTRPESGYEVASCLFLLSTCRAVGTGNEERRNYGQFRLRRSISRSPHAKLLLKSGFFVSTAGFCLSSKRVKDCQRVSYCQTEIN